MTRALIAVIAGIVWIRGWRFLFAVRANRSIGSYLILEIIFLLLFAAVGGLLLLWAH